MGVAVSGLRDTILAHQANPEAEVDWQAVLGGLDALEHAVAELRALVTRNMKPDVGQNGECLHPLSHRQNVSTFDQNAEFCGRCGEML